MIEIFRYLTIKEKLLPCLLLSKSLTKSISPAAFKNDELLLHEKEIEYIDSHKLSSSTGRLFSTVKIIMPSDKKFIRPSARVLNYFPSIKIFDAKCTEKSKKLPSSNKTSYTPVLIALLQSASLVNIKSLSIEIFSTTTAAKNYKDFKNLRFPQLESLTMRYYLKQQITKKNQLPISDFLFNHVSMTELNVDFYFMKRDDWKNLFSDSSVLPNLNRLIFLDGQHDDNNSDKEFVQYAEYLAVVEALATTIIPATNQPRPLKFLDLDHVHGDARIFHLLSRIPTLTSTQISIIDDDWPVDLCALSPPSIIKSLTKFINYYYERGQGISTEQLIFFFHVMSYSSLKFIELSLPVDICFTSETMKYLSQLKKLEYLSLSVRELLKYRRNPQIQINDNFLIDWTDCTLFTSWQFSSLSSLELGKFRLSRESFAIIAAASPNVKDFIFKGSLGFHLAILCLITGSFWRDIISIWSIDDDWEKCENCSQESRCLHKWEKLSLEEFEEAKKQFPPHPRAFHRLLEIQVTASACTTPDIWYKILQLFNKAELIHCVDNIYLPDPEFAISVMGLSFLPSLRQILDICELPQTIVAKLNQINQSADHESAYCEPLPKAAHPDGNGRCPFDANDRKRYFKMTTQKYSYFTPLKFIDRPVKNGMNGREAFFDDIYQSMNESDQSIVNQLSGDTTGFATVTATNRKNKRQNYLDDNEMIESNKKPKC